MEHGNTDRNMKLLGWSPLSERRAKIKISMLYKIRTSQVHVAKDDLIQNQRKPLKYFIPYSKVDSHKYSFYPSTIRLWNSLPSSIQSCSSTDSFKAALDNYSTIKASCQIDLLKKPIYFNPCFLIKAP